MPYDQSFVTRLIAYDETAPAVDSSILSLRRLEAAHNRVVRGASTQFGKLTHDLFPGMTRQVDRSSSALAGMAARYLSIGVAINEARKAIVGFSESDKSMRLLSAQMGVTTAQTVGLEDKFRTLANQAGRTTEEVVAGFNNWRVRSGLARDAAERLYPYVVKGATLAGTSVDELGSAVGVLFSNMRVAEKDAARVWDVLVTAQSKYGVNISEMMRSLPQLSEVMREWGYSGVEGVATMVTLVGELQSTFRNSMKSGQELYSLFRNLGNEEFLNRIQMTPMFLRQELDDAAKSGKGMVVRLLELANVAKSRGGDLRLMFPGQTALVMERMLEVWNSLPRSVRESAGAQGAFNRQWDIVSKDAPWTKINELSNEYHHLREAIGKMLTAAGASQGLANIAGLLDRIAGRLNEISNDPLIKLLLSGNRIAGVILDWMNPFGWERLVPDPKELQKRIYPGIYGPGGGAPLFPGVASKPTLEGTPPPVSSADEAGFIEAFGTAARAEQSLQQQAPPMNQQEQELYDRASRLQGLTDQLQNDMRLQHQKLFPRSQIVPRDDKLATDFSSVARVSERSLDQERSMHGTLIEIRDILRTSVGGVGPGGTTEGGMPGPYGAPGGQQPTTPGAPYGHPGGQAPTTGPQLGPGGVGAMGGTVHGHEVAGYGPLAGQKLYEPNTATSLGGGVGGHSAAFGPGQHEGVDVMAPEGSPTYSAFERGRVVKADGEGRNKTITVEQLGPDGKPTGVYARYLHQGGLAVKPGDIVGPGQQVGTSGFKNAAHTHFELWQGQPGGRGSKLLNPKALYGWDNKNLPQGGRGVIARGPGGEGAVAGGMGGAGATSSQAEAWARARAAAVAAGSPDPDTTAAIMMHESGWLKSDVFRQKNNPFGQTAPGGGYRSYGSMDEAARHHVQRWGKFYGRTPGETIANLRRGGYNTVNPGWGPSIASIRQRMAGSSQIAGNVPLPQGRPMRAITEAEARDIETSENYDRMQKYLIAHPDVGIPEGEVGKENDIYTDLKFREFMMEQRLRGRGGDMELGPQKRGVHPPGHPEAKFDPYTGDEIAEPVALKFKFQPEPGSERFVRTNIQRIANQQFREARTDSYFDIGVA